MTSIGGNLEIDGNAALTSLTGLEGVTSIGGHLHIEYNAALTSLTGLEGVTSIGGHLHIEENNALTSLTGLEEVTSIGGNLSIYDNAALTSLTGLENINAGSIESLAIFDNLYLSECAVQSICDYLASPDAEIWIDDNAEGCNSVQQVEEECGIVDVQENKFKNLNAEVWCYPNPFSISTTIAYELQQPAKVQITIYNYLGKQIGVIEKQQPQGLQKVVWSAENLPAGIYYIRLRAGKQTAMGKMVVMR